MPVKTELPALVDTNVIMYSLYKSEKHHAACVNLLKQAHDGEVALCVFPQIIGELYSNITPAKMAGSYAPTEAVQAIEEILRFKGISLLPLPADVVPRLLKLLAENKQVRGGDVFDVQLVAAMQGSGIKRVYTYNRKDFVRFDGIEVLEP